MKRLLIALLVFTHAAPTHAKDTEPLSAEHKLSAEHRATLDDLVARATDFRMDLSAFERAQIEAHGSLDPLFAAIGQRADDKHAEDGARDNAAWLLARFKFRYGDVDEARTLLEKRLEASAPDNPDAWLMLGELQDAAGKVADAATTYERILQNAPDHEAANTARWNLSLLRLTDPQVSGDAMALVQEAVKRDPTLRIGTGVTLAVADKPEISLTLLPDVPADDKKAYWRAAIRAAEWGLAAKQAPQAQAAAWRAVKAAPLKRDARFSLAVLVDAHLLDNSLEACVKRFADEAQPTPEMYDVWVDLLRELGRVDEALALFHASAGSAFTDSMQRALLELCRESGREEELVKAFEGLIEREPRRVEWREGLSRHWLSKAQRGKAGALWTPLLSPESSSQWLPAASSLAAIGLETLAIDFAERAASVERTRSPALLFLFDLYFTRGQVEKADQALADLDAFLIPSAKERMQLADAYERLGKKPAAAEVLQGLRDARGVEKSEVDLDIRLAVLLSETDQEKEALALWRSLWSKVHSIPRRRFVEDRMLTIASRLGKLADLAVEFEEAMAQGTGGDRESGLLVRLYTKVNDPVSAAEILGEHVRRSGGSQVSALSEQARIYLTCTDYLSYERTVRKLIKLDPEGEPDYLRQLAMSALERGRPKEARDTLARIKSVSQGADSDEFEAGVLALGGLEVEAIAAYRRGLVRHPDRIEAYLLLANVMRKVGEHKRAIGMFQSLVQRAAKDDLYTVAIDGLLNMDAPPPVLKWARRRTLARLAIRPDKTYLYQLVADLSEELKDRPMQTRALANALPSANEQRASYLRELMDLSASGGGGGFSPFGSRATGNNSAAQLRYGRRLLRLGDLVPPGVFLELGRAFLSAGDVGSAAKTFRRASDLPDYQAFQLQVAGAFEKAGYVDEALRVYEEALIGASTNVSLMTKVARTHETLDHSEDAANLFARAIELMLARRPFSNHEDDKDDEDDPWSYWRSGNVDAYEQYYSRARRGLLATYSDERIDALLDTEVQRIEKDLTAAKTRRPKKAKDFALTRYPRVDDRAAHVRRVAFGFDRMERADALDATLLAAFPDDEKLLAELVKWRQRYGLSASARKLIENSGRKGKALDLARVLVGAEVEGGGRPHAGVLIRQMLPAIGAGDAKRLRALLRDVDTSELGESAKTALPVFLDLATYLEDPDLVLIFGRAWLTHIAKSKNTQYWSDPNLAVLNKCWPHLGDKERNSLVDMLTHGIMENVEKSLKRLPHLVVYQRQLGKPILTEAQVTEILDKVKKKGLRFPPTALKLVPEARRAEVLDSMWRKSPPTSRVWFLLQLVTDAKTKLDDWLRMFVTERFDQAVKDLTSNKRSVAWRLNSALEANKEEAELILDFAERMKKVEPGEPMFNVTRASALDKLDRTEEALAVAGEALTSLYNADPSDWRRSSAARQLIQVFLPKKAADARALLEQLEKDNGLTPLALDLYASVIQAEEKPERLMALYQRAVKSAPKNEHYLQRLLSMYRSRGDIDNQLATAERLVELQPQNKAHRNTLSSIWKRLRHPLEAKRAMKVEDAPVVKEEDKRDTFDQPTVARLKEAVEAGDAVLARRLHHQLWRGLGKPQSSNRSFVYIGPGGQLIESGGGGHRGWTTWPKKQTSKRNNGGMPDFEQMKTWEERSKENTSSYEILAQHDFGTSEMRVQLRLQEPTQWGAGPQALYDGLVKSLKREKGLLGAVQHLLTRHREGRASTHDYAMLLLMLEDDEFDGMEGADEALTEVAATVMVFDPQTTQRLARVMARNGRSKDAARLYVWLGARGASGQYIKDAQETLEGELRTETLTTLLKQMEPSAKPFDDPWSWGGGDAIDSYNATILDTWGKVLDASEVLETYRALCEASLDTEKELRRSSAQAAALLYARAGEHEQALKCLEVAIGRFPDWRAPDKPNDPSWRWRKRWVEQQAARGRSLNSLHMKELFPAKPDEWKDAAGWTEAVAKQLVAWLRDERVVERSTEQMLSVLAVRLHKYERMETRDVVLAALRARQEVHPANQLWIADALRNTGHEDEALAMEMALLESKQIYIGRIPDMLDRAAKRDGVADALAMALDIAKWTQDPDILRRIITYQREQNQPDDAATWLATAQAAWPDEEFE